MYNNITIVYRYLSQSLLSQINNKDIQQLEQSVNFKHSVPWIKLLKSVKSKHIAYNKNKECLLPSSIINQYHDSSVTLSNLKDLSLTCLINIVQTAAIDPAVIRVNIGSRPRLLNFETRGILQSNERFHEPYSNIGLDGTGQIVGIADSGLNDLSCFFMDDSNAYPTVVTNRTGIMEPLRRKVIQYSVNADFDDQQGGHGTHVSGTVAGSSAETPNHNGMAPAAKISFYDIGM